MDPSGWPLGKPFWLYHKEADGIMVKSKQEREEARDWGKAIFFLFMDKVFSEELTRVPQEPH